MTKNDSSNGIEQYDNPLAVLAHRLWVHWSQHIAEEEQISEERIQRWRTLWVPYGDLDEDTKYIDHRLVERFCEEEPDYSRTVDAGCAHELELGTLLSNGLGTWKVTNRMVDTDTEELLYRLMLIEPSGPRHGDTQIRTEKKLLRESSEWVPAGPEADLDGE